MTLDCIAYNSWLFENEANKWQIQYLKFSGKKCFMHEEISLLENPPVCLLLVHLQST